jgi:hypothetical protein
MGSVFWDSEVIRVDFLLRGEKINAQYYSTLLRNHMHHAIRTKRAGRLMKIIILHENAEEMSGQTDENHHTA